MRERLAVWTALLLAGCGAPETPRPVARRAPSSTPVATIAPTAAPAEEEDECPGKQEEPKIEGLAAGGPWVGFFARAYDPKGDPSLQPVWAYRAPGLPAISKDGTKVLTYTEEPGIFGSGSGERLEVLRASDGKVVSTTALRFGDHREVAAAGDDPVKRTAAWDALARVTAKGLEAVNAKITAEGWSSLVACRIDLQPEDTQFACSMKDQEVRCGDGLSATYEEPRLDVSVRGKKVSLRKPEWLHKSEMDGAVAVNGCLDAVYYHPAHALLMLHLDYVCQTMGDWCYAPGAWRSVALPRAPGPDAPPPQAPPPADCPAGMAAVPAGSVVIESDEDRAGKRHSPDPVAVGGFCLDLREVTVARYTECVKAGRCFSPDVSRLARPGLPRDAEATAACNWGVAGREEHPMNCVSRSFAEDYCAWAGGRLPAEREWQWAASGAAPQAARTGGVCSGAGHETTCPVGASAGDRGPFGTFDMAANVSEWTSSGHEEHDACFPRGGNLVRGGSYVDEKAEDLRAARRRYVMPAAREPWLGFRCAKERAP